MIDYSILINYNQLGILKMALSNPRDGCSIGFHTYGNYSEEVTVGSRKNIIWSSIKHLCSSEVADGYLKSVHSISNSKKRSSIAKNIRIYINHAFNFYSCAEHSSPDTAPLLYYYSYLNLAKALCEIKHPPFHKLPESRRHGLRWQPDPNYLVDMLSEKVNLSSRGVWHVLWETITGGQVTATNQTQFQIRDLFSCCPGTTIEYERTFGMDNRLISLCDPEIKLDHDDKELWLVFSVERDNLKTQKLSRNKFINQIANSIDQYRQVKSGDDFHWTFELTIPKKVTSNDFTYLRNLLQPEIRAMNLFVHPGTDGLYYSIPDQSGFPIRLPQLLLVYTIVFWLGSLVRYDPHSLIDLQQSRFWILIDGFITQSCLWLLELFEWELYKTETFLTAIG